MNIISAYIILSSVLVFTLGFVDQFWTEKMLCLI